MDSTLKQWNRETFEFIGSVCGGYITSIPAVWRVDKTLIFFSLDGKHRTSYSSKEEEQSLKALGMRDP